MHFILSNSHCWHCCGFGWIANKKPVSKAVFLHRKKFEDNRMRNRCHKYNDFFLHQFMTRSLKPLLWRLVALGLLEFRVRTTNTAPPVKSHRQWGLLFYFCPPPPQATTSLHNLLTVFYRNQYRKSQNYSALKPSSLCATPCVQLMPEWDPYIIRKCLPWLF